MILRKINAGLSLLTTLLFMDHAIFFSVWMLSRCRIEKSADIMPRIFVVVMAVHAVLSIILVLGNRKGAEKQTCRGYFKRNGATYLQRIAGIFILCLLGLHIAGAVNHFQPKILHAVLHPLFFAAALAHVSVSTGKALITLGIGNAKAIRRIDRVMKIFCSAVFAAAVIGFYLCLFAGVTR